MKTTMLDSRADKAQIATPPELLAALEMRPEAGLGFAALSPSCRREYIEWITQAKRPETRERRVAETVAQVTERKHLAGSTKNNDAGLLLRR